MLTQTATSITGSSVQVSYTYDGNGNQLTMTDSTGVTTRTYDELNRVTSKHTVTNDGHDMGTYSYYYDITTDGNTAETAEYKNASGVILNRTTKVYDKSGRLINVKDGDVGTTTSAAVYVYYPNGSRKSITYDGGAKEEYTYYDNGLLKTLTNSTPGAITAFETYTYSYDAAGNMIEKTDKKGLTSYEYDKLSRLKKVSEPGRITEYTYDAAGNRETETINGSTVNTYLYDEQNRLQSVTTRINGAITEVTGFEYDNNGNQTKIKRTPYANGVPQETVTSASYGYDVLNQLTTTIANGVVELNYYNGEGLRVKKTVNGDTTRYLYEYDQVVLETDNNGKILARNIYGTNLLMRTAGAQSLYYMYNGHADVTALIDAVTKAIAATYYYDAFGNLTDTTGNANNSITYAGYQYDKETGLYYCNARMYDPKIARFLQEDTYTGDPNDPLSLNLYTYCNNEPLMYSDPTGHFAITDWLGQQVDNFKTGLNFVTESNEDRKKDLDVVKNYGTGSNYEKIVLGVNEGIHDSYEGVVGTGKMVYDTYKDPVKTFNQVKSDVQWLASDKRNREFAWQATQEMGSAIKTQVVDYGNKVLSGDPEAISRGVTNLAFMWATDKGMNALTEVASASRIAQGTRLTKAENFVSNTMDKVDNFTTKATTKIEKAEDVLQSVDDEADKFFEFTKEFDSSNPCDILKSKGVNISSSEIEAVEGASELAYSKTHSEIFHSDWGFGNNYPKMSEKNLYWELQKSDVGRETLAKLENGDVIAHLNYVDRPIEIDPLTKDKWITYGDSWESYAQVYVKNTQSIEKTAGTLIHEVTHASGITGSRRAELICRVRELQHIYRGERIPFTELLEQARTIKEGYSHLPYHLEPKISGVVRMK